MQISNEMPSDLKVLYKCVIIIIIIIYEQKKLCKKITSLHDNKNGSTYPSLS